MVPFLIFLAFPNGFPIISVFPVIRTNKCVSYVHQTDKVNSMPYSDLLSHIITEVSENT